MNKLRNPNARTNRFLVALAGLSVALGVGALSVLLDFVEGGFDEFGDDVLHGERLAA